LNSRRVFNSAADELHQRASMMMMMMVMMMMMMMMMMIGKKVKLSL
jgi:ABC-type Na+ efflux pump permease subunit